MKYLTFLKDPKNIIAILALLAGVFRTELGLDAYLSDTLSIGAMGAVLLYLGYSMRDAEFTAQAERLLRPKTLDILGDIELYIERRYNVALSDDLKAEIVGAIFGEDADAS